MNAEQPGTNDKSPRNTPRKRRPRRGGNISREQPRNAPVHGSHQRAARDDRTAHAPQSARPSAVSGDAEFLEQRKLENQTPRARGFKNTVSPRQRRRFRQPWTAGRTVTIVILLLLLAVVFWRTIAGSRARNTISYTEFTTEYMASGNVNSVRIIGDRLEATLKKPFGERKLVYLGSLQLTPSLIDSWAQKGVTIEFHAATNVWGIIVGTLPYVTILVVVYFLFRNVSGGQKGVFSFGESRAREITADMPGVTFAEVAGVEEAKQELQEIVEFLRDPQKFQRLGGRIPRGVLMVGPPGTGKTYLARAIAGEARVPFFSISGSDFVEMFVGVGASRVRDLFEKAKKKAPCIVFIDEIDAVGRHRGAGLGGGHDEREQTLNQLLVEMDGFSSQSTVILMAATNRPDVLDPALLRPGRFDRHIVVNMPDVRGREGILRIHTRGIPLARNVDLHTIARGTPGLSGADLRNLANEAALLAARNNRSEVGMREFEIAKEKVMWGSERRSLVMSEEERRVTAVHEAGHALVAICHPVADSVHKVTIVPRGRSLGLTAFLPGDERHTVSRHWCDAKLTSILGGRAAEEIVLGDITNGAANDIELATELARKMVCEWGMSKLVGPVALLRKGEEVFVAKELGRSAEVSEQTLQIIDKEVNRIVEAALAKARDILEQRRTALDALSAALLAREVLDRQQIDALIAPLLEPPSSSPVSESTESVPKVIDRTGTDAVPSAVRAARPEKGPEARVRRSKRSEGSEAEQPSPVIQPESVQPEIRAETAPPVRAPVSVAAPSPPVMYGRRPKMVKRFALPTSQVPENGIPVASVVSEAPILYGRSLRSETRTKAQSQPLEAFPQAHASEGNSQGSREPEERSTTSRTVSGEQISVSDMTENDRQGAIGGAQENTPQSADTNGDIEPGAADTLAKVDEAVGST